MKMPSQGDCSVVTRSTQIVHVVSGGEKDLVVGAQCSDIILGEGVLVGWHQMD